MAVDSSVERAERACALVHGREVIDGDPEVAAPAPAIAGLKKVDLHVASRSHRTGVPKFGVASRSAPTSSA